MQDRKDDRQELGEQEAARRDFLGRLGKASLGIPATIMLMSVTDKQASATGNSISGGGGHFKKWRRWHRRWHRRRWRRRNWGNHSG